MVELRGLELWRAIDAELMRRSEQPASAGEFMKAEQNTNDAFKAADNIVMMRYAKKERDAKKERADESTTMNSPEPAPRQWTSWKEGDHIISASPDVVKIIQERDVWKKTSEDLAEVLAGMRRRNAELEKELRSAKEATSAPFNKLTPKDAELLTLLAEECAEVVQAVTKILRHGLESHHPLHPDKTNRELLEVEIGHVLAANKMVRISKITRGENVIKAMFDKRENVKPYLHHQEDDGG